MTNNLMRVINNYDQRFNKLHSDVHNFTQTINNALE